MRWVRVLAPEPLHFEVDKYKFESFPVENPGAKNDLCDEYTWLVKKLLLPEVSWKELAMASKSSLL